MPQMGQKEKCASPCACGPRTHSQRVQCRAVLVVSDLRKVEHARLTRGVTAAAFHRSGLSNAVSSGLQRSNIAGCSQQVLWVELADYRRHKSGPGAVPIPMLHVVKLPRDITRRASGQWWHRADSIEISAMTRRARGDLAAGRRGSILHESLALLEASGRYVSDVTRMRIAQIFRLVAILWDFENSISDRLFPRF